jgi:hypothetical protein
VLKRKFGAACDILAFQASLVWLTKAKSRLFSGAVFCCKIVSPTERVKHSMNWLAAPSYLYLLEQDVLKWRKRKDKQAQGLINAAKVGKRRRSTLKADRVVSGK